MNADAQILPLSTTDSSDKNGPPPDLVEIAGSEPLPSTNSSPPRRNGKIAHLPKAQRDLINQLFDDGFIYDAVSRKLAEQGVSLNLKNLSDWYHGGYQDELQARERRDQLRLAQDQLLQLARQDDAPALSAVGLQLAITQLAQQLHDIAPGSHKDSFRTDTHSYLRMLNTLARLSKSLLAFQKYHDAAAKSKAAELKQLDVDRDLSDREYELLVKKMDQVFKVARRPTPKPSETAPPSAPLPSSTPPLAPPSPAAGPPFPPEFSHDAEQGSPPVADVAQASPPASSAGVPPAVPPIENQKSTKIKNPNVAQPSPPEPDVTLNPNPNPNLNPPSPVSLSRSDGERAGVRGASPIENPEYCPRCGTSLPPRLPSGERPSETCPSLRCGAWVRTPGAPIEECPHCGVTLPDLLPNGQRAAPTCFQCHKPLPPPAETMNAPP